MDTNVLKSDESTKVDPYLFTYSDGDVLSNVDGLIKYYRGGSRKHGKRLSLYTRLGLLFSVGVTVISGVSRIAASYPWIITIAGGLATLFAGLLSCTKAHEYYLHSGSQHAKVYAEKLLYLGAGGPYSKETTADGKLRVLAERVQDIYAGGARQWEGMNRPVAVDASGPNRESRVRE